MQFLLEGAKRGERGLYITLSETENELRESALSHGWDLVQPNEIFELVPPESLLDDEQQQSRFTPPTSSSARPQADLRGRRAGAAQADHPRQSVRDPTARPELAPLPAADIGPEALFLAPRFHSRDARRSHTDTLDKTVHSVAHGVIRLEELAPEYGAERRRLRVNKYRGQRYRGGYHDFVIDTGGVRVFPRLVSSEHRSSFKRDTLKSASPELDALLGGGLERGSSTLVIGPAGTGKSLLTLSFAVAAVERGESAALFIFDEKLGLLFERAKGLGLDLQAMVDGGNLVVFQVDAAELAPGEFAHRVRAAVEEGEARTVVIDSLNGYQAAMPQEQQLILHMHELLQFLNRKGTSTFLTVAQHGLSAT